MGYDAEAHIADAAKVMSDNDFLAQKEELEKLAAINKRWMEFWRTFREEAARLATKWGADPDLLADMEENYGLYSRFTDQMIRLHHARKYVP